MSVYTLHIQADQINVLQHSGTSGGVYGIPEGDFFSVSKKNPKAFKELKSNVEGIEQALHHLRIKK